MSEEDPKGQREGRKSDASLAARQTQFPLESDAPYSITPSQLSLSFIYFHHLPFISQTFRISNIQQWYTHPAPIPFSPTSLTTLPTIQSIPNGVDHRHHQHHYPSHFFIHHQPSSELSMPLLVCRISTLIPIILCNA